MDEAIQNPSRNFVNFLAAPESPLPADPMLSYFLSSLAVRVERVKPTVSGDPVRQEILADLQTSLRAFDQRFQLTASTLNHAAWTEAYRMERMLALIVPATELISELKRQTAEATDERLPSAARLVAALQAYLPKVAADGTMTKLDTPAYEEDMRSLLLEVLEELHWAAQRKFYARPILKQATYRIVWAGLGAFIIFLIPYLTVYLELFTGNDPSLAKWSGLPLYTSLTAGLFGALFSRLLFIQQNRTSLSLGSIRDAREMTSILLRGCVGTTGAVIVYFFLQSGILQGGLFPHFDQTGFSQLTYAGDDPSHPTSNLPIRLFYPNPSLALLVVWCFIAGFSERLVPSILQSTETTLGKGEVTK